MYIYRIIIQNYRNLRAFDWKPDQKLNVLFGPNGCGKSNLAEALSLVFSYYSYDSFFDPSDFYMGDENNQIIIQVWLDGIESLPTNYSQYLQHISANDEFISDDFDAESKAMLIYQLTSGEGRRHEWQFFQHVTTQDCKAQARKAVQFTWIPADREPLREIGLNSRSALYRDAQEFIAEELTRISSEIVSAANHALMESPVISEYLKTLDDLSDIDLVDKYRLMLKDPSSTWKTSGYELGSIVGEANISFCRQSKGIQNLFLLLLMKKQLEGSAIVFIEELEQNLEPQKQRYIAKMFRKLGVGQLFITSHSPDIISEFDYENIGIVSDSTAIQLGHKMDIDMCKATYQTSKKEFLAALMSSSILLVEGESESAALPIFAQSGLVDFGNLDLFVFFVGGKGRLEKYCKAFKQFSKAVLVFIDNDSDVTRTINTLVPIADQVFVVCDSYEDLIIPYKNSFIEQLNELVEFSRVQQKLVSIFNYNQQDEKRIDTKKQALKRHMESIHVNPETLSSYSDLSEHVELFKFTLHDSFTSPFFARSVAQSIVLSNSVPRFMQTLANHLKNTNEKLALHQGGYTNVFRLEA